MLALGIAAYAARIFARSASLSLSAAEAMPAKARREMAKTTRLLIAVVTLYELRANSFDGPAKVPVEVPDFAGNRNGGVRGLYCILQLKPTIESAVTSPDRANGLRLLIAFRGFG